MCGTVHTFFHTSSRRVWWSPGTVLRFYLSVVPTSLSTSYSIFYRAYWCGVCLLSEFCTLFAICMYRGTRIYRWNSTNVERGVTSRSTSFGSKFLAWNLCGLRGTGVIILRLRKIYLFVGYGLVQWSYIMCCYRCKHIEIYVVGVQLRELVCLMMMKKPMSVVK